MTPWPNSLRNDMAQFSMLRMSECSSPSRTCSCSKAGLRLSANTAPSPPRHMSWLNSIESVGALDLDDSIVAAAAASRSYTGRVQAINTNRATDSSSMEPLDKQPRTQ